MHRQGFVGKYYLYRWRFCHKHSLTLPMRWHDLPLQLIYWNRVETRKILEFLSKTPIFNDTNWHFFRLKKHFTPNQNISSISRGSPSISKLYAEETLVYNSLIIWRLRTTRDKNPSFKVYSYSRMNIIYLFHQSFRCIICITLNSVILDIISQITYFISKYWITYNYIPFREKLLTFLI